MTYELNLNVTTRVNPPLLVEELIAALGDDVLNGLLTEPERIRLILAAVPSSTQTQTIQDVLAAHDPDAESSLEQAERARRTKLAVLRALDVALEPEDFSDETATIRKLARKVLLLEAQQKALARGLRNATE